jgi:hypothetical protein
MMGSLAAGEGFVSSSRSRREGGKTGSVAWSKEGGSFLCVSNDEALVVEEAVWPSDFPETVELKERVEEFEPRRVSCVEVLRGGRVGVGCDACRAGRGGGALRAGSGGVFAAVRCVLSRSTGGGGRRPALTGLTPTG